MIKYELFKKQLETLIQNSNLDLGAVLFILKDVLHTIETMYYEHIQNEIKEQEESKQENNRNANNTEAIVG